MPTVTVYRNLTQCLFFETVNQKITQPKRAKNKRVKRRLNMHMHVDNKWKQFISTYFSVSFLSYYCFLQAKQLIGNTINYNQQKIVQATPLPAL